MLGWIGANYQWIFSGFGVALFATVFGWIFRRHKSKSDSPSASIVINNNSTASAMTNGGSASSRFGAAITEVSAAQVRSREDIKATTRILFIDDDTRFKVVKILKNSGWVQTSLVKDISSINDSVVVSADIVFIDIQGVGVGMGFRDEGLGLAGALKERHPEKRVVIYSAEPRGQMFHEALKKADASLNKNADPYEFERLIEGFVGLE